MYNFGNLFKLIFDITFVFKLKKKFTFEQICFVTIDNLHWPYFHEQKVIVQNYLLSKDLVTVILDILVNGPMTKFVMKLVCSCRSKTPIQRILYKTLGLITCIMKVIEGKGSSYK